ncbi:protein phosphatase 1 regulatory subunit 21 isoform X2 [Anthonomus grandis grandis]|uniref:protein phosphatase 1 regulatory subunit 21 isoform X2 n=1 Tax=Anthonomus grandis grandis TaxID=2921223 RepID=UPI0021659FF2|nr:protein phosphatase 1 regulatory subunit 21 isoform X2 [Anthonomus grandis grandis]
MEKPSDLEEKYQKLAAEYSKVRSQANVLKKAVLDEQAKNSELKDLVRNHEQTIRKHDQEMESLTFRNEQLTKRISVLQQELQGNNNGKKGKSKMIQSNQVMDLGILDEEFQKKILENAQLLSSISDKELEIAAYKEQIEMLEEKLLSLEKFMDSKNEQSQQKLENLQRENDLLTSKIREMALRENERKNSLNENDEKVSYWRAEAEKLRAEYDRLSSKPSSDEQLNEYYESQVKDLLDSKSLAVSETKSLMAENQALKARLEDLIEEHLKLQSKLDKSIEELVTTNDNYKNQLDAMTEHLAAQNDKITQQCDEIQLLKHKISSRK